jgi:hypothetical protein
MKVKHLKNSLYFLSLFFLACSGPRIHIPSQYETKAVFQGEEEINVGPNNILEAGDLAEEFPEESIINDRIKVTVDFTFNDKYDSSLYYKQYISENKKADSLAKIEKAKKSKNKTKPELTEHPIPDGQVFMSSTYEYEYRTIRDFVEEPIVLHYNSMVSVSKFYAKIDNNSANLKKRDESNDGYMYFKTDSRYKIYDLNLPIRGTEVSYEYTEECRDAKFNSVMYIPDDHFTQKKIIKIALHDYLKFEIIEKNFEGLTYTKDTVLEYPKTGANKEKIKYLVYTFKRLKGFQNYESDRGPSYNYPMLYFQFKSASKNGRTHQILNNTDDLYRWYRLVSSNLTNDTSAFAQFTKNLVKDKKSDEDKIKTVFYWIQDNIRYIAFEDGIAGFRPDECADVFRKRYGDCKGMANLTKNMLKVLGYDARMVWIGTKHQNFSYDAPGMPVDNHAICAVKLNGKYVFLDGTENYIAMYDYANRIQGRKCIVENEENYTIETVPEWGYEHNEASSIETINISGLTLNNHIIKTYKGESKLDLIRGFNYLETESKSEVLYNYLKDNNINFKISNIVSTDLGNRDIVPEISYDLNIQDQIIKGKDRLYVNIEWERDFDRVWFDSARKVDFDLGHKNFVKKVVTLNLNKDQKVIYLPTAVNIDNDYYTFKLEMKVIGNTIVYNKTIINKKDYLPSSMLKTFVNDCKQLSAFYNTYIEIQ